MGVPRALPSTSGFEGANVEIVVKHTFLEIVNQDVEDVEADALQYSRYGNGRGRSLSDSEIECTPVSSTRRHGLLDLSPKPRRQKKFDTCVDEESVYTSTSLGMTDETSLPQSSCKGSSEQSETGEDLGLWHDEADKESQIVRSSSKCSTAADELQVQIQGAKWADKKPARTPLSAAAAPFQSKGAYALVCVPKDQFIEMMHQDQYSSAALHNTPQQKSKQRHQKIVAHASALSELCAEEELTTLMLRNLPNRMSRDRFVMLLNEEGFDGAYDFVYLPFDFYRDSGFGYAFVNFVSNENAKRAMEHLHGFKRWDTSTPKVCDASWSCTMQGLQAHVQRFRDSPVMHESVPECFKPMILKNGVHQPFPPPTKSLRAPRIKGGKHHRI